MEEKILMKIHAFGSLLPGEHFVCVDDMTNEEGAQEYRVSPLRKAELFRHNVLGDTREHLDFPPEKLVLRIRS